MTNMTKCNKNIVRSNQILHAAIEAYGKEAQTLMLFEEAAELEKEICKDARGKQNHDAIAEEIADVEIMLAQIKIIHDIPESQLNLIKADKIKRLGTRIGIVHADTEVIYEF